MDDFGKRLKQLREQHNLTQLALSVKLGISQEALSAYECNKTNPSIEVLKVIAKYFRVSADYLIGLDNCEISINEHSLNSFEVSLLRNYRVLSQNEKELLVKISAVMADFFQQIR